MRKSFVSHGCQSCTVCYCSAHDEQHVLYRLCCWRHFMIKCWGAAAVSYGHTQSRPLLAIDDNATWSGLAYAALHASTVFGPIASCCVEPGSISDSRTCQPVARPLFCNAAMLQLCITAQSHCIAQHNTCPNPIECSCTSSAINQIMMSCGERNCWKSCINYIT